MRQRVSLLLCAALLVLTSSCSNAFLDKKESRASDQSVNAGRAVTSTTPLSPPVPTEGYVTARNGRFELNGKPFYFAGTNNYYVMYKSNSMINNVLADAAEMGFKVIRSWAFMDGQSHDGYVLQPKAGQFDDSGMERLDYTISQGKKVGLRFVLALVNYWPDFGGMPQYASWYGLGSPDKFYTDASARAAYKAWASHVLNHVNRYTGIAYKDEPAIFGWNLTNEARNPSDNTGAQVTAWAREMSDYINAIDSNHLISLGDEGFYNIYNDAQKGLTTITPNDTRKGHQEYNGGGGVDFSSVLALPNIDYGVMHNYAQDWWSKDEAWSLQWVRDHLASGVLAGKPIVLEEYSRKSVSDSTRMASMKLQSDIVLNEGGAGTMSWMLVSKDDAGGTYRDHWDDGFQIVKGDVTADMLSAHAVAMWAKNGTGTNPRVDASILFGDTDPDPDPVDYVTIDAFDSFGSDAALAQAWIRNGNGNSLTTTLTTGIAGGSTKAMAMAWTLGTPSYAGITRSIPSAARNWSTTDGISITLKADTVSAGHHLTIQFKESSGEYWESNLTLASGGASVKFAAWSAFARPSWYSGGNGIIDLSAITEISLYMGGSAGSGTLIVDDLQAGKGTPNPVKDSSLSASSGAYTPGSRQDISVGVIFNGNTLSSIRREGTQLVPGTDYTVSSSGVVLKSSWLETLTPSTTASLSFFFSAGASPSFSVQVGARQTANSVLSVTTLAYTLGTFVDAAVGITYNGNTLKAITKSGTALRSGTDYTVTAGGVVFKSSWLEAQSAGTFTLNFTFSAGSASNLSVTVSPKQIGNAAVSVQYHNANTAATTIQMKPELIITNTGTSALAMSNLKVKYWFTNETNTALQAVIWWTNKSQSSAVCTIGSNFVEISYPGSTESLSVGASYQINFGVNANNWSNFSQTNDYSYLAASPGFAASTKITARLGGSLIWGIEP